MPPIETTVRKLRWIGLSGVVLVSLCLCSYRFISPSARVARYTIQHLSATKVSEVVLEPAREASLIQMHRHLTDPIAISGWTRAFASVQPFRPEHPLVQRCMYVSFATNRGTVGGQLCTLRSGRLMLTQWSSVRSGWYYGSYLLPASTQLEPLLRAAGNQPAPNNSFKPKPLRGSA
jgi:hypothetical protein